MSTMVRLSCGECGIEFDVPEHFNTERRETGLRWYCPNGHCRVYKESDLARARRERDRAIQENARLTTERDAALLAVKATQERLQRQARRQAAGTCPCCQRSFQNMARHMKSKHPDYVRAAGAQLLGSAKH